MSGQKVCVGVAELDGAAAIVQQTWRRERVRDVSVLTLILVVMLAIFWVTRWPYQEAATRALNEAGVAAQLKQLGIEALQRKNDTLTVRTKSGLSDVISVCPWNKSGECGRFMPGGGRGYEFAVGENGYAFHGDDVPSDWSKTDFVEAVLSDVRLARPVAIDLRNQADRIEQAKASWGK